jgi:hypothetical protein
MNGLAGVLLSLNRLKNSEELYKEALNFRKSNLLPHDPRIGSSMYGLAFVLYSLNRLK